jgi:transporter family protein
VTAEWIIATLVFIPVTGALGITSKYALADLRWQDLILWTGIGYVLLVIVLLLLGVTRVQFVSGSAWAVASTVAVIAALFSFYIALSSGQAGKVVPVSAAYPAVTLVLAAIFLSEHVTVARAAGMVLVVIGVMVLTAAR